MKSVDSLCPVVGLHDHFVHRFPWGEAHAEPIERDKEDILNEPVISTLHTANHVIVDIQEVAKYEREKADVEYRARKESFDKYADFCAKKEVTDCHHPHDGVDKEREDFAPDNHMDKIGLNVAFDPSAALVVPIEHVRVGFLVRGRVDNRCLVAAFGKTHAEVAILGNVKSVPA